MPYRLRVDVLDVDLYENYYIGMERWWNVRTEDGFCCISGDPTTNRPSPDGNAKFQPEHDVVIAKVSPESKSL